ncbi:MAG: PilZ domain-containing protein [Deltaproteobacteria bacterium]|nr:PilZ domain-containing protein [Deltaproteobacteria bacterium]
MVEGDVLREDTERLPAAFRVTFESGGGTRDGVAVNVSRKGLCLRTNGPLADDQEVRVLLPSAEGPVEVTGVVRWVVELSPLLQPTFLLEAGIGIDEPPPAYEELFSQESARFVDYRHGARVPHQLRVEVVGPGFWETTFALNLGRKGVFVRTDHDLVPGQLVELKLFVPGAEPILVRAEVVHLLSREAAAQVGAEPGAGLRIGSLPLGVRDLYHAYVEDLEQRYRA